MNTRSRWGRTRPAAASAVVLVLASRGSVWAHGGALDAAKGGPATRVVLDAAARESIGLATAEAEFRPIDDVVGCTGTTEPRPNSIGVVSTRVDGRVIRFYANLGDHVTGGQRMVEIETRQVGNPPPTITVTTPIGGVVVHRDVELGEAIEPGKHLMHVMDLARLNVTCKVFESDLSRVALGQQAHVRFLAYPNQPRTGSIVYLSPTLDPETRTVDAWVEIDNRDELVKPAMFASVTVVIHHDDAALAVPKAALLEEAGETFVYVMEGDAFVRKDIVSGASDDQFVEVKDGLVPGDRVVTDGKRQLHTKALMGGGSAADDD